MATQHMQAQIKLAPAEVIGAAARDAAARGSGVGAGVRAGLNPPERSPRERLRGALDWPAIAEAKKKRSKML
jgi:hypothetical protein